MQTLSPAGSLMVEAIPLGLFETNAWLLVPAAGPVTVVDPGMDPEPLLARLQELGRGVERILLTHGHLDHVAGCAELVRRARCPVHLHPADRFLYDHLADQAAWHGFRLEAAPSEPRALADGERLAVGDGELVVLATPGHSPGSVCFHVGGAILPPGMTISASGGAQSLSGGAVLCGDTLFAGSFGRTDLPGGSFTRLKASVMKRLLTLPGETALLPGHGPASTVAREGRDNPILTCHVGDEA